MGACDFSIHIALVSIRDWLELNVIYAIWKEEEEKKGSVTALRHMGLPVTSLTAIRLRHCIAAKESVWMVWSVKVEKKKEKTLSTNIW